MKQTKPRSLIIENHYHARAPEHRTQKKSLLLSCYSSLFISILLFQALFVRVSLLVRGLEERRGQGRRPARIRVLRRENLGFPVEGWVERRRAALLELGFGSRGKKMKG